MSYFCLVPELPPLQKKKCRWSVENPIRRFTSLRNQTTAAEVAAAAAATTGTITRGKKVKAAPLPPPPTRTTITTIKQRALENLYLPPYWSEFNIEDGRHQWVRFYWISSERGLASQREVGNTALLARVKFLPCTFYTD